MDTRTRWPPVAGLSEVPGAAQLAVDGLTCRVGRRQVLDGLSLDLAPGEVTALLGPAGSGKTILLGALAGSIRGTGSVRLDGREVGGLSARRRGFGVLGQDDTLSPRLTLAGNVAVASRAPRHAARLRLAEETLAILGAADAAGLLPWQASPAARLRAVIARAAVAAPRLLLLDDPFAEERGTVAALACDLRRLHGLIGTTTLLATRAGAEALAVADRIAVLAGGQIVQHGKAQDVFDRPCSVEAAGLLGEVNLLPGRVEALEDDEARVRLDCGPTVEALAGPGLSVGACMLAVRPDRIAVVPVAATEMGEGALDATVLEARAQGSWAVLRLLIGSGAEIVVQRPAAAGLRGLTQGRTVAIAWQPHHARAFARDAVAFTLGHDPVP